MKDDAAKLLIYILLASVVLGLCVMGGFWLVTGEPYTSTYAIESNAEAGFYPYIPPTGAETGKGS